MREPVVLAMERDGALHAREPLAELARELGDERPPALREDDDILVLGRTLDRAPSGLGPCERSLGLFLKRKRCRRRGRAGWEFPRRRLTLLGEALSEQCACPVSGRCRGVFRRGFAACSS